MTMTISNTSPRCTESSTIRSTYSIALLTALSCLFGCGSQLEADQDMDTMQASVDTRARLGIDVWGTYMQGSERRVVALDAAGAVLTEMDVQSVSDDTLQFLIYPEGEKLTVSSDGKFSQSTSDQARALVEALSADSTSHSFAPHERDSAMSTDKRINAVSQALTSIAWESDFERGGGLFGYRDTFDAGWGCGGAYRTYYDSYVIDGSANCYIERWVSDDPTDCRVRLHIGISAFGGATCRAIAYVDR